MTSRQLFLNEPEQLVMLYFRDRDGRQLRLAPYQSDFVKTVLTRQKTRIVCVAATQAGKSEQIACAIALLSLWFPNERIVNVSYTDAQARIIFERVKAHLVDDSPVIRKYVDLNRTLGSHKEFSKSRMFMKNGTEIRVMSTGTGETEETGESLLGFEATILVVDECGSIPEEVMTTKVMRMLGAKRSKGLEEKMLILSGTPHKTGFFEDAYNDENYIKFKVDWKQAVDAGRMDLKTVEEQKRKMTKSQFESWYEAIFPTMTEDSVFDMAEVERNIVAEEPGYKGLKILSVDVARMGNDWTVYTMLDKVDDSYRMVDVIADEKKDLMGVTGHIVSLHSQFHFDRILVDAAGLGGGVADRLKEQGVKVTEVVAGSKCTTDDYAKMCLNLKAELFLKAKKLFENNKLKIVARRELLRDLRLMKKDFQSNGKIKIVDPAKSPDFADSLVYGLYVPAVDTFTWLNAEGFL